MDELSYRSYRSLRTGYELYPDSGKQAEIFLNHTVYGLFDDAESFYIRYELEENDSYEEDLREEFGDPIVNDVLLWMRG